MATIYDEPSGCNCANISTYNQSAINAACTQALSLASQGQTIGKDKYPHAYNDYEHFSFPAAKKPYLEFPIMTNGKAYTGDESPGADRIVIGSIATDYQSAIFCAVITHDGSTNNGFTECKNDTTAAGNKAGDRGKEDRELLDKIEL